MPKVLKVEPADIHVTMEFSLKELEALMQFIEEAQPLHGKVFEGNEVAGAFLINMKQLKRTIEGGTPTG